MGPMMEQGVWRQEVETPCTPSLPWETFTERGEKWWMQGLCCVLPTLPVCVWFFFVCIEVLAAASGELMWSLVGTSWRGPLKAETLGQGRRDCLRGRDRAPRHSLWEAGITPWTLGDFGLKLNFMYIQLSLIDHIERKGRTKGAFKLCSIKLSVWWIKKYFNKSCNVLRIAQFDSCLLKELRPVH